MTLIEHQQTLVLALVVVFSAIGFITWAVYRIVRVCKQGCKGCEGL